jgi:hypothetical protein
MNDVKYIGLDVHQATISRHQSSRIVTGLRVREVAASGSPRTGERGQ